MILEPIPFNEELEVLITFLQPDIFPITRKAENWRRLRGTAKGTDLTSALLRSRKEDLLLEKSLCIGHVSSFEFFRRRARM
jgi:hypothetical protein